MTGKLINMKITQRKRDILDIVNKQGICSISKISQFLKEEISTSTLNREISELVEANYLTKENAGRSTAYRVSIHYDLFNPISLDEYFELDVDKRCTAKGFNYDIMNILQEVDLLKEDEKKHLNSLRDQYQNNIQNISDTIYKKELERLTIELSWKSAQIEGNTYSLLETELLFREKTLAKNKSKDDAIMLLNHKDAFNYILENKDIAKDLSIRTLEEIHSILIKDLGVSRNIRYRSVGITGTNYKPLDNEYQIKENLQRMCRLINSKSSGFEKALIAVLLISYIQPFEDGNKRSARMICNALLISCGACPLSYRSIDPIDYKKAILIFYEQNNISTFKDIFIKQNEFSVKNYFL